MSGQHRKQRSRARALQKVLRKILAAAAAAARHLQLGHLALILAVQPPHREAANENEGMDAGQRRLDAQGQEQQQQEPVAHSRCPPHAAAECNTMAHRQQLGKSSTAETHLQWHLSRGCLAARLLTISAFTQTASLADFLKPVTRSPGTSCKQDGWGSAGTLKWAAHMGACNWRPCQQHQTVPLM